MNWLTDFGIPNKHFTNIHSVRAKMLHEDRQRDMMKLTGNFCNCFSNGYKRLKTRIQITSRNVITLAHSFQSHGYHNTGKSMG